MATPSNVMIINGVRTYVGPRGTEQNVAATMPESFRKTLVMPLVTVAGTASLIGDTNTDATVQLIPAKSVVVSANLHVVDAFTATTAASITVGFTGNSNGLFTATAGAKAKLVAGAWIKGDGAIIVPSAGDNISVGSSDVYLLAAWNAGDATAVGNAVLVLEYYDVAAFLKGQAG